MYDYTIIGGGIIGLATAWQLIQQKPGKKILILEKEAKLAQHQTGHNSGVIHAGIYYQPGSLKAEFCKQGLKDTIQFCQQHQIPYEQCGKLLIATNQHEISRMHNLFERAKDNELDVELLDQQSLQQKEPNVSGLGAIYVKKTGIVDYTKICERMAAEFQKLGGEIRLDSRVSQLNENVDRIKITIENNKEVKTKYLICCSGLMADRVANMLGIKTDFQIIPFRGEYYQLPKEKNKTIKHLIYPIPDPELPFLGIHLTKMIDGSITIGPNAVQGWKREGYGKINFSLTDTFNMLSFPGFWKVSTKYFKTGIKETINSWWKRGYFKQAKKYYPQLQLGDLQPYPAGVRAQAVLKDGALVHDFLFAESPRSLHVCNAPSPAATSAIPIGQHICDKIVKK